MTTHMAEEHTAVLILQYDEVRSHTERLCAPLAIEDYVVTAMTDASPAKWHLAHTTWFFETFILKRFVDGYRQFDPDFSFLFNSYYVQAGERHCRAQRGLVTRPTVREVYEYRAAVNESMRTLLHARLDEEPELQELLLIGLNHEQQHQELLVTDLKYLFFANPIRPAYDEHSIVGIVPVSEPDGILDEWVSIPAGIAEFGHLDGEFSYDNETPRHTRYLQAACVARKLVTNAEYVRFMLDGGYRRAELWLSAGIAKVQECRWDAPLYWERDDDTPLGWRGFTLNGMQALRPDDPVCHISYYEADAYARWLSQAELPGARLPTEFEWEFVAPEANAGRRGGWYDSVWQWTSSPYIGYPGYRPAAGAIGEYNGKFMADQWVLRGSSMATPSDHTRRTYRNFFAADARWQFSGLRLATDM